MKVTALANFVHGGQDLTTGAEAEFSDVTAAQLKNAGLVRYSSKAATAASVATAESGKSAARTAAVLAGKKAPEPKNKKAPEPGNKGALQDEPVQDLDAGAEKLPVEGGSEESAESKAPE